ncbi:MAG: YciI-like protein [Gemmatimonadaceae bacterium]
MHYLLFYDVVDDYADRRARFRDAHLEKAWTSHGRGELLLGGALVDPIDGAVLLFRGDSPRVAEEFAKADPYVVNGLVRSWRVRAWSTVAGELAATPIRPGQPTAASGATGADATGYAEG